MAGPERAAASCGAGCSRGRRMRSHQGTPCAAGRAARGPGAGMKHGGKQPPCPQVESPSDAFVKQFSCRSLRLRLMTPRSVRWLLPDDQIQQVLGCWLWQYHQCCNGIGACPALHLLPVLRCPSA